MGSDVWDKVPINPFFLTPFLFSGYCRGRSKVHSSMSKIFFTWSDCVPLLKAKKYILLRKNCNRILFWRSCNSNLPGNEEQFSAFRRNLFGKGSLSAHLKNLLLDF